MSSAAQSTLRKFVSGSVLLALLFAPGCVMPLKGKQVWVNSREGEFWSGEGILLEVSPDQEECKVAVRDKALVVNKIWVRCNSVHPRKGSHPSGLL